MEIVVPYVLIWSETLSSYLISADQGGKENGCKIQKNGWQLIRR